MYKALYKDKAWKQLIVCGLLAVLLLMSSSCHTAMTYVSPYSAKEVQEIRRTPESDVKLDPMSALSARMVYKLTARKARKSKILGGLLDSLKHGDELVLGVSWFGTYMEKVVLPGYGSSNVPLYICYPNAKNLDDYSRVIYFVHGGSFVNGTINMYALVLIDLAQSLNAIIVAPMYTLAPEVRWPGQPYEVLNSYRWVLNKMGKSAELPRWVDKNRAIELTASEKTWRDVPLYSMGDSAGGNLASVLGFMCADFGIKQVDGSILFYPVELLLNRSTKSRDLFNGEQGGHFILEQEEVERVSRLYFADPEMGKHRYASPLLTTIPTDYPATIFVAAEADPLRDDSVLMHKKLHEHKIDSELIIVKNTIHGFLNMPWIGNNEAAVGYVRNFVERLEKKKKQPSLP